MVILLGRWGKGFEGMVMKGVFGMMMKGFFGMVMMMMINERLWLIFEQLLTGRLRTLCLEA